MKTKNPLTLRMENLGLTQIQVAVLVGVSQGEVSKTLAGAVPVKNIEKWAKTFRITVRKFRAECEAAQWALPLWKFSVSTPKEIETIKCSPRDREAEQTHRMIAEYTQAYREQRA